MTSRIRASVLGLCLLAACGGSKDQEVLDGTSSSSSSGASSGSSGQGSSSGTSGTSGTSGQSSGNTSSGSSGQTTDGGVDAGGSCVPESEPNNDKQTAQTIVTSVCGAIDPANDIDFLTFKLQATTKNVSLTFEGAVSLKVDVGDQSVVLDGKSATKIPFVQGKPYFVEVVPNQRGGKVPWRVNLVEK